MEVLVCLMIMGVSWVSSAKLSCDCGRRNYPKRIINGKETGENEYPWMVYLSNGCGGSIITRYHVLTAAHCTSNTLSWYIVVAVGMHYRYGRNEHMEKYSISEIIQHNRYTGPDLFINDIAILVIEHPMTFNQFISPICMPTYRYDLDGKFIKVTGWGLTKGTGDNNVLREVNLKVISYRSCTRSWWYTLNKIPTQICTARGSCNGDSGGPYVYQDPESKRYTQVALVSYGPVNCVDDSRPSVNTDVYAYMDWIKQTVAASQPRAKICMKISRDSEENFTSTGGIGDLLGISKDSEENFTSTGGIGDLLGISKDSQEKSTTLETIGGLLGGVIENILGLFG